MAHRRSLLGTLVAAVVVGIAVCTPASASEVAPTVSPAPGEIRLVSTTAADRTRASSGYSGDVDISADGRYVVFASNASDLVTSPASGGSSQIYLSDTATGTVRMISVNGVGVAGDSFAKSPSISDDGRRIAYITTARNLVPGLTSGTAHAVVWDRETGETSVASIDKAFPSDRDVLDVDLSGDGKVVAFSSAATNLTNIPTYNKPQVYRRDLVSGETRIMSVGTSGNAATIGADSVSVSRDGAELAFSAAGLEYQDSASSVRQIFRATSPFSALELVSVPYPTTTAGGNGDSTGPFISADGESVAFASVATNFSDRPATGRNQIYVRQMRQPWPEVVSGPVHRGGVSSGTCSSPSLDERGSRVAFVCDSTDLLPGLDGSPQAFVLDRSHNTLRLVSQSAAGVRADAPPKSPVISDDGSLVAFASEATTLTGHAGMQAYLAASRARAAVERIGGADRYEASASISRQTFPPGVPVAFIASGQGFADALAGSATAGWKSAPVLLVTRDSVPGAIREELRRLAPKSIVILGGTSTIAPTVEAELSSLTSSVSRLAGADRYATAFVVSKYAVPASFSSVQRAAIASGEGFADALAGSPLAGCLRSPVLLTPRSALAPGLVDELSRLGARSTDVFGGPSSVSDAVFRDLQAVSRSGRYAGADRYATAADVADEFGVTGSTVYVASGETYPDALSASAAAIQSCSPVVLTTAASLPDATKAALTRLQPRRIVVVGGPRTVTDAVLTELEGYLPTE